MPWRKPEYFTDPYYGISGWVAQEGYSSDYLGPRTTAIDGEILVRLHEGQHPQLISKHLSSLNGTIMIAISWTEDGPRVQRCELQYTHQDLGLVWDGEPVTISIPTELVSIVVSRADLPDDWVEKTYGG